MTMRFHCPGCRAEIPVEGQAGATVVCPGCGRRITVRARTATAGSAAPTRRSEEAVDSLGTDDKPTRPSTEKPPKAKRRKKQKEAPRSKRIWMFAVGGGVLAVGLIVALVFALKGKGKQGQIEDDLKAREQATPVNEFPPVAWRLQPGPAPKVDFPDSLTVASPGGFAWEVFLPGSGPEYLSVEPVPAGQAVHFGRFDLKTGKPAGPSRLLKVQPDSFKPSAVAPDGTLILRARLDPLLQIYDPNQDTPRSLPGLTTKGRRGPSTQHVTWFEFAGDNRLWILGENGFEAWDLKAGKSTLESKGPYTLPIIMGPDRKWLIAGVDDRYLEVLDTATGECRGRFGGEGRWQALAVSADGQRLAGARYPGT